MAPEGLVVDGIEKRVAELLGDARVVDERCAVQGFEILGLDELLQMLRVAFEHLLVPLEQLPVGGLLVHVVADHVGVLEHAITYSVLPSSPAPVKRNRPKRV